MGSLVMEIAAKQGLALYSLEFAAWMDEHDPLASFRSRFCIPLASSALPSSQHLKDLQTGAASSSENNQEAVYLCGHSLGLMPKSTPLYLDEEIKKWAVMGVEGHFTGKRPWAWIDEKVVQLSSELIGAKPSEVSVMGSLTNNLHLLMLAFYRPTKSRFRIIVEDNLFCSDSHAVLSQIRFHGLVPDDVLVKVFPRQGEATLRTEDILAKIGECGTELALVLFSGVQYYTGQFFDMKSIVASGHQVGAIVGFDLAHAVGNVVMHLHDWDVDFACWCSYKYLNSGPGSIAGLFVHEKHANNNELTRLDGWWGQALSSRFKMESRHYAIPGAQAFQMSNPCVIATVCVEASLEIFHDATMSAIQDKQRLLTGFLEALLDLRIGSVVRILTPRNVSHRGSQISIKFTQPIRQVHDRLSELGIISDVREPDVLRICPAPLYNTFTDVFTFVDHLYTILNS